MICNTIKCSRKATTVVKRVIGEFEIRQYYCVLHAQDILFKIEQMEGKKELAE